MKPLNLLCVLFGLLIGACATTGAAQDPQFAADMRSFLLEGEKLSALTQQGVSILEYRNQLANVKAIHSLLAGRWPSDFASEESTFDRAVEGWDLALQVWNYHIDNRIPGMNVAVVESESNMKKEIVEYLKADPENSTGMSDTLISAPLAESSQSFREGRASITE